MDKKQISITMKKSNGSVIDINTSAAPLGEQCRNIPAMYAITGYNTTWQGETSRSKFALESEPAKHW